MAKDAVVRIIIPGDCPVKFDQDKLGVIRIVTSAAGFVCVDVPASKLEELAPHPMLGFTDWEPITLQDDWKDAM